MPRGQPDYGMYTTKVTGATLADSGELAARLGSIVIYDRKGDVMYLDDYESPAPRFLDLSSDDCAARLDSRVALSGAQSAKLETDGTLDNFAWALYDLPTMVVGKHGIKISVFPYQMGAHDGMYRILFNTDDGTNWYNGGIEINLFDKTIKYLDSASAPQTFVTAFVAGSGDRETVHDIKLVFDIDTAKYVKLMFDLLEFPMTDYSFRKVDSISALRAQISFQMLDLEGYAFGIWQDDFVYTINEP